MHNLRSANLNLLPVLRVLLRHQHVTHAARALNMSQSSVSEALGNLRYMFNDELLVQRGNQLTLTALAQRLEPLLELSLTSIATLFPGELTTTAEVRTAIDIAAADYLVMTIGAELAARARAEKPDIAIRFHDHETNGSTRLRNGTLDFMFTPEITVSATDARFNRELIYEDRIVCLVDKNSDIGDQVSEEQYWAARHVFFSPKSEILNSKKTTILQQIGERGTNATLVQSYLLLPFFVEKSATIALVQNKLAERLAAAADVRVVEAPFDIPLRFFVMWDGSHELSPLQTWCLETLRAMFAPLHDTMPVLPSDEARS